MLRDAGVRTKLLAVLAIPTVLLVVVTALLVGGQITAARRAGQVNALTDVAIQVNRVVHSLQEERSATLALPAGPRRRRQGRGWSGQRQFTNQQLRELRKLVADSPVDADVRRRPGGGRPVGRRPRRARRRPQVRRRRPLLRHRDRRLLHQGHPRRPRPARRHRLLRHHRAGPAPAGLRGALHAPSSTPPHERDLVEVAPAARHPDRGGLRARLAPSSPSSARRCRTSSATRAGRGLHPPRRRARRVRRSSRSTRYAGHLPDLLKGQRPGRRPLGRVGRRRELADRADDQRRVRRRGRHRDRRRGHPEQPGAARAGAGRRLAARPRPGPDAGRRPGPPDHPAAAPPHRGRRRDR